MDLLPDRGYTWSRVLRDTALAFAPADSLRFDNLLVLALLLTTVVVADRRRLPLARPCLLVGGQGRCTEVVKT